MPNPKINWVNDHTQICDRLNARVQLMEDYLDSKPDDFDGITVKRFLLSQAREQISWYRQSIKVLDFVGCVACRRALETGQSFLEHYLPAYNFREAERVTHLASKNRIRPRTCYAILYEIEQRGDFQVTWGFADDGYSDTVRISRAKPKTEP